jgi:hypothetical protein
MRRRVTQAGAHAVARAMVLPGHRMRAGAVARSMDRDYDSILHDALALDHESKVELTERLAIDLANHDEHLTAWVEESRRRYGMIKRGEMKTVDAKEAIDKIRKSLFSK